jgi:DnaJ domain
VGVKSPVELDRCYRLLGVRSDADLAEIKTAFRRLAREYHPDRNKSPGAEEMFNSITEAYSTILGSHGLSTPNNVRTAEDGFEGEFGGKINFTVYTDKEVVHSVSPKLFEREVRKRFNPDIAPGTSCKIGKTWYEIVVETSSKVPLFGSRFGKRKSLLE